MLRALCWEIKMDCLRTFRYRFGMITDIIVYFVLFTIFMVTDSGMSYSEKYHYANYKELMLIGYVAWIYAISAISNITNAMRTELMQGTLYKKISSKYPLQYLFGGLFISSILLETLTIIVVVITSKVVWSIQISFHPQFIVPIIIQSLGMYGIGLMIAGFTVYYKRIGSIVFLIQTALLFVTDTVPTNSAILNVTKIIPLTNCNDILKKIVFGESYSGHMLILILTSAIWLLVGIGVFEFMNKCAKRKGNLLFY